MDNFQQEIISKLRVAKGTADEEMRLRIAFLKDYLLASKASGFLIAISGGQDSTLAGILAKLAIDELNAQGHNYTLFCINLPYGKQTDTEDVISAMDFIFGKVHASINIKPAVDAIVDSLSYIGGIDDFTKGNIKARQRMVIQYAIAAKHGLLVLGTGHAAESLTGFFTKNGDGAADLMPLAGLTKRMGRGILALLGCPPQLYTKTPTADLEDDRPGLPDEEALGITYNQIDDYLEGKPVELPARRKIERYYLQSYHKRALPITPEETWWRSFHERLRLLDQESLDNARKALGEETYNAIMEAASKYDPLL